MLRQTDGSKSRQLGWRALQVNGQLTNLCGGVGRSSGPQPGGGGKFTAGKLGAEAGDLDVLDKNDPNYDSEGEEPEKPNNDTFFDKIVRGFGFCSGVKGFV